MSLQREIRLLTHDYVAKGGKQNRRKQAKRMIALGALAEQKGCRRVGELGKKHVIAFYAENRSLSDAVLYQHWLAFRELWSILGKNKEPPEPRYLLRGRGGAGAR